METHICHYKCSRRFLCCWLCDNRCKLACTLRCAKLTRSGLEEQNKEPAPLVEPEAVPENGKRLVTIRYAAKNQAPDQKWREQKGFALIQARGPGPKNVLIKTEIGDVVVPRGNVKWG